MLGCRCGADDRAWNPDSTAWLETNTCCFVGEHAARLLQHYALGCAWELHALVRVVGASPGWSVLCGKIVQSQNQLYLLQSLHARR